MPSAPTSAVHTILDVKRNAYELRLVNHGCENHFGASNAFIEGSPRQLPPEGKVWARLIHFIDQEIILVGFGECDEAASSSVM